MLYLVAPGWMSAGISEYDERMATEDSRRRDEIEAQIRADEDDKSSKLVGRLAGPGQSFAKWNGASG